MNRSRPLLCSTLIALLFAAACGPRPGRSDPVTRTPATADERVESTELEAVVAPDTGGVRSPEDLAERQASPAKSDGQETSGARRDPDSPATHKRREPAARPETLALPTTVIDRVFFAENDSSVDGVVDALDAFAALVEGDDQITLILIARADRSEREPDALSSRRALSVRSYLVRRGVPERRIRIHALGVKQPRATTTAADAGAANRCVELATE